MRCPTRRDAIDYITTMKLDTDEEVQRRMLSARLHVNHAHEELKRAARSATGPQALLLEHLSVRLRPFIVELDNILIRPTK